MGRDVDLSGVDVGTVVKVKGGVGSFREVRQMQLERICTFMAPLALQPALREQRLILSAIIRTTNEEAAAWAENTAFQTQILSEPWVVSEKDARRARRKAEGLDREKRSTEERKRRKRREEADRKRAAAGKDRRRGETRRREDVQGQRDGKTDPSRRQACEEHRDSRRDADKARKSKV